MNADSITLEGLLGSSYQYVIPVFQRYYSWKKSDWENVWNDISDLRDAERDAQTHFMGSLVLGPQRQKDLGKPAVQVIDGQQRLMTFSLLLSALRNVARDRGFEGLSKAVEETALLDPHEEGRERFRVYPRQRDRDSFMAAVEGNGQQVDGRVEEALRFFTESVAILEEAETEKQLRDFFNLVRRRLEFVHVILDNENAYEIFRSLNSTGQPLSEADLVRNFVFMHMPLDKQDRFDDELWTPVERHFEDKEGNLDGEALSGFFRDFLMRTGRYVKPAATFQEFERRYSGAGFEPEDMTIELGWYADYYDVIRGVKRHSSDSVESALAKLRGLQASTTYPLLLNLLHRREEGMTDDELVQCLEMLSGFILRRFVCGESSRSYSRWFVSANRALGDRPIEGLRHFLQDNREFPEDKRFQQAFVHFNLYGSLYGRYALEMFELAQNHREPPDLSKAQIEHIMPQTLSDEWKSDLSPEYERIYAEWLHTLGNPTLSAYNPELYNHPFDTKCKEYNRSNITITRQLANYSAWSEDEIQVRGANLAELATRIWSGPSIA